jgi:cation:H+ antiporter
MPLTVTPEILRREYPVMLGVMVLFYLCALDGVIGAVDGLLMVGLLLGLGGYLIYDTHRADTAAMIEQIEAELTGADPDMSAPAKATYLAGGMIGLALGAHLMVDSAIDMAHLLGVPTGIIGLTAVAFGTSLPELAASLVSAAKGDSDLSVGNVMGSNVLNVLFVVGVISIIEPLEVSARALRIDFPVMLGVCGLLLPLTLNAPRISRVGGSVLLLSFLSYITFLLTPYL